MTIRSLARLTSLCLIIFVLSAADAGAQYKYDLPQYIDETGEFIRVPLNWSGNDWLKAGAIAAGTFALMFTDNSVRSFTSDYSEYKGSLPMEIGRLWGEPFTPPVLGIILIIHGNLARNNDNKKVGFELLQSYSYNLLVTGILKIGFGRGRPYLGTGPFDFDPVRFRPNDYWSLPSGHTSIAFTMSTVLASNTGSVPLKVLYFSIAGITGISRMIYDQHWLSDVVMGALIGYFVGSYVNGLHEEGGSPPSPDGPNFITFSIGLN